MLEQYLTNQEKEDYLKLTSNEARRLFIQSIAKNNFPLFVYILGYRDLGEFHKEELKRIAKVKTLESPARRLWLWARGFFKTSLITEAHSLWLIVNNPNIRILIVSFSLEVAKKPLGAIRNAFISNEEFRFFFREFCPLPNKEGKIEWGTTEALTVLNRTKPLKEPTVMCAGVGTNITGLHFDCLLPNTEIFTSNGWKKIKDIKVHNRVLTLDGSFRNITDFAKKQSNKEIVRIYPKYFADYSEFTQDHKIFIFNGEEFDWIEAGKIKISDFLVIPRTKSHNGSLSKTNKRINNLLKKKDIWRLIGYWLAEGAATQGNSIRLTFSHKETDYVEDVRKIVKENLDREISVSLTKSNTLCVFFTDIDFKTIVNTLGTHSHNKHLPPFFINNNSTRQKELLFGYFRGDGCFTRDKTQINFVSVSKDLLTGIQLILAKFGIHSSLRKNTNGGLSEICGIKCNTREKYSLNTISHLALILFGGKASFPYRCNTFFTNKYWCIPIKKIERITKDKPYDVYDISVNGEHNFFCQGLIAHNCIKADDLVNRDSVTNDVQLQASKDYYSLLRPLFDNPTKPIEDVVGTIYHFDDLHSKLKENPEFEQSFIPAHRDMVFTFPERLNEEGWEKLNNDPSVNPYDIQSQWLLNPINPKDAKFKSEWIRYYDELPESLAEYICVDPASTRKKKSDYTVMERWGIDHLGIHYLLEGIRDKLEVFQRRDKLFEMVKRSKNLRKVKYEVLGGRHGDLEAIRQKMREGTYFVLEETKSTTASKEDRIEQRLVAPYHAGVIRFPRKCAYRSDFDGKIYDFVQDLITELLQFPFTVHDDCLDCQSQMFEEKLMLGSPPKNKVLEKWKVTPDGQFKKILKKMNKKIKVKNVAVGVC